MIGGEKGQRKTNSDNSAYPEEYCSLGKYEKLETIGEGGFSRVYKAFDPDLERWVALKVLNNGVLSPRKVKDQFFEEIKTLAQLNIPNTVRLFDCGEDQGWLFYSMELINGVSLEEYCTKCHPELEKRLKIIKIVALALSKLHKSGIIHRDIKPRNVMIDEHEEVKLLDFGLVAQINREHEPQKTAAMFSGSPGYMPPEMFEASGALNITPAVDIYSLGVLAYEVLSGDLPYDIEFLAPQEIAEVIFSESPKTLKLRSNEKLDPRLDDIVMRSLNLDPGMRPTADEFATAIDKILNGKPQAKGKTILFTLLVLILAGGIIYSLMELVPNKTLTKDKKQKLRQETTLDNLPGNNDKVEKMQLSKAKPTKATVGMIKTFYLNTAPEELCDDWQNAKHELAVNSSMKNKGVLIYVLPDKHTMKLRHGNMTLLEIDSAFQKKGCCYQPASRELTLEIRRNRWDTPVIYKWNPIAGNADVFRPAGKQK